MNTLFRTFLFVLIAIMNTGALYGQAPQRFNYQAVLRNNAGEPIASQGVTVNISILQGSIDGTEVFSETHNTETNEFGLINLQIGSVQSLNVVDWKSDEYFLQLTVDDVFMGVTQLLSVPFAMHAKTAETVTGEIDFTETDPVFQASSAAGIGTSDITNWDEAHSWGDHEGLYREAEWTPSWDDVSEKPEFADVAISGSYDDLEDKPLLFDGDYNSLSNLPDLFDGQYSSLTGTPVIPADITDLTDDDDLLFDGDYNSLDNLPVLNIENWNEAHAWGDHSEEGYLTGYTVTEADVTAHQEALLINENQITDLGNYIETETDPTYAATFNITNPSDGDLLRYNATSERWEKYTPDYAAGDHVHDTATDETNGFMSASDKTKLDDLQNVNIIAGPGITITGSYPDITITTTEPTYSIGLNEELGGYVFYVTPDGKHGLVAATQDQDDSSNWGRAKDAIINPDNHDDAGKKFTDWRLPTMYELNLMYQQRAEIGGFSTANYWSSSTSGLEDAHALALSFFSGNIQHRVKNTSQQSIRAVRSF